MCGWGYHDDVQTIEISGERGTSEVVIGCGELDRLPDLLAERALPRPSAVVTNTTVAPLYGLAVAASIQAPPPIQG